MLILNMNLICFIYLNSKFCTILIILYIFLLILFSKYIYDPPPCTTRGTLHTNGGTRTTVWESRPKSNALAHIHITLVYNTCKMALTHFNLPKLLIHYLYKLNMIKVRPSNKRAFFKIKTEWTNTRDSTVTTVF